MSEPVHEARKFPGKQVGRFLYIHVAAVDLLEGDAQHILSSAVIQAANVSWNVAKIGPGVVSFLLYEDFDEAAFPALLRATRVDIGLGSVSTTDYSCRKNPPILHRKELLLPFNDPRRPSFAALTRCAEEHGLFKNPSRIGTRESWNALIEAAGLKVVGQKLVPINGTIMKVARHKTAITRRELSQPLKLLVKHSILVPGMSVFDYGCGQGDDVAALIEGGYEAFGWDPHHAPNGQRREADLVNLGFVVNVIEDPHERIETLRSALSFARKAMSVSSMVAGRVPLSLFKPYRDGVVTARGTFQKYFHQHELRDLIRTAVGDDPVALAPGIFVVFLDKHLEQEFLLRRLARRTEQSITLKPPTRLLGGSPVLSKRIKPQLELFWQTAMEKGRLPEREELPNDLEMSLREAKVSPKRAMAMCLENGGDAEALARAAERRRSDLLVHFALMQFPGAPRYQSLPSSIQRDVKAFFSSHSAAQQQATKLLFSAGDRGTVQTAAANVVASGLGAMWDERRLRVAGSTLPRLPALLRVLIGSAEVLHGGVGGADFLEIDLELPELAIVTCDNAARPLPEIVERVRINLSRLKARLEDPRLVGRRYLFLKSRYMAIDDPARPVQEEFDNRIIKAGLVMPGGAEPTADEFDRTAKRLFLSGHETTR